MALNVCDSLSSRDVMIDMIRIRFKQRKCLNVCHINAQSINNKIDEFRLALENSSVDFIRISETLFNDTTPNSLISAMVITYLGQTGRNTEEGMTKGLLWDVFIDHIVPCILTCDFNSN